MPAAKPPDALATARDARRMSSLLEISQALSGTLNLRSAVQRVLLILMRHHGVVRGMVTLLRDNELHVEAGHKLNASLLKAGLVDELLVYLAPLLIGQGRGMTALGPLESLGDAMKLTWLDTIPIGPDLRLRARLRETLQMTEAR